MKKLLLVIIGILLLSGFFWFVRQAIKESSKTLPGVSVPDQGRKHVPFSEWEKFKYNSNPPTSGPHDEVWTKPGIYEEPQGDGHLVHSLEHGYVIVSYNCSLQKSKIKNQSSKVGTASAQMDEDCLSFVEKLKQSIKKDKFKLVLVPRINLDTDFAQTAWTRIDKFNANGASMERVENFINAFRNHGPEQTME